MRRAIYFASKLIGVQSIFSLSFYKSYHKSALLKKTNVSFQLNAPLRRGEVASPQTSFAFIILFTRLLCDNSNSLTYEPRKGAKSNTFTCQLCDCTSHADWLFTIIIVTWTYEDLFRLVTNALKKALVF